jgi:hypothetical protein
VLLRQLQQLLGQLYDADGTPDVREFLLTDATVRDALKATAGDGPPARAPQEELLVLQTDDGVDLALYLDAALLERLQQADPCQALTPANLADFWTALEGVSHFNYLAWNAGFDKPVTLMELEMQAEVDKYVTTRALLARQPGADLGSPLLARLFEDTRPDPALSAAEECRYRDASALAGRYCRGLQRAFPGDHLAPAMLRDLRGFFRATQARKLALIRAMN